MRVCVCVCVCVCCGVCVRDRQTDRARARETEPERQSQRDRARETEPKRQRQRQRQTDKDDRQTDRQAGRQNKQAFLNHNGEGKEKRRAHFSAWPMLIFNPSRLQLGPNTDRYRPDGVAVLPQLFPLSQLCIWFRFPSGRFLFDKMQ